MGVGLAIVPVFFQYLDLVAVRVFDKEVAREQFACVVLELAQILRRETETEQAFALGTCIVNHDGNMAVAVAMRVRRFATLVPGKFDFSIGFVVAQINEREIIENTCDGDGLGPLNATWLTVSHC